MLVPSDVTEHSWAAGAQSSVTIEGVEISMPSRAEILERSGLVLDRIEDGVPVVSLGEMAGEALACGLTDGLVAVVIDVCLQHLVRPDDPIDWERAGKALVRSVVTSAASSFLAAALARDSLQGMARAVSLGATMRAARVAVSFVPRLLDAIRDVALLDRGEIAPEEFRRRCARSIGAAAFEALGMSILARLTARLAPLLRGVVLVVGGIVLAGVGAAVGELAYQVLASFSRQAFLPEAREPGPISTA